MRLAALALAVALASCREQPAATDPAPAAPAASAAPSAPAVRGSTPASASALASAARRASAATPAAPRASTPGSAPGSAEECRVRKGPLRLSLHGPALLWPADSAARADFRVIFNREGAAKAVAPTFPDLTPRPAPAGGPAASASNAPDAGPERGSWPACAIADQLVFCMDPIGAIRRSKLSGGGEAAIAAGRRGSAIAAAALPGGHTVLAFLGDRRTTEGVVTQAFATLDDGPAVPLSEEGSGATHIALSPWKDGALAVYVDARAALTPVHARAIRLGEDGRLALGPDAVIFVGGGAESRMTCAIAAGASGPAFVLVPTSHEVSGFGMAAVRVDDPPKDDAPSVWSMYPNGLSPAPIAATHGADPIRVARVRPATGDPASQRALELGRLGPDGVFQASCVAVESSSFSHVTLDVDRDGALWLAYTSAEGTFVELRGGARRRLP